jgi:hypothetical protein
VSQKRCGMLPARSSNVSRRGVIHHALARATRGGCTEGRSPFDESLGRATFTFVLCHRKKVQQGILPCRGGLGVSWAHSIRPCRPTASRCSGTLPGFGVSPSLPILPPRLGARGLKASVEMAPSGAGGIGAGGHSLSLYALDSRSPFSRGQVSRE